MDKKIKRSPELQTIEDVQLLNAKKSERVSQMEDIVHNFDIQKILALNEKLRKHYGQMGDKEILELIDRMTLVMNELSEIIEQVKAKRITLEQGQREIQDKLQEINQVLQMMQDWNMTGI